MKKNIVRIISIVLLLMMAIQTFCFADISKYEWEKSQRRYKHGGIIPKTNNSITITKSQMALLIFLSVIAFVSLFVVIYYLVIKYLSNKKNVHVNNEEVKENSEQK